MKGTLYNKLWQSHLVTELDDGYSLIYIDRHIVHEVTSPQAFAGMVTQGRTPWRTASSLAMLDHNVPTRDRTNIKDPIAKKQIDRLVENCTNHAIPLIPLDSKKQGIVHVVGPELGACLPGMTIVCGDSHTATNGALGALALGIGTSEVEHVFTTNCLLLKPSPTMQFEIYNRLPEHTTAKDLILSMIGRFGTAQASGYALEYAGEAIRALSMEERMTVCNMSIEIGARAGFIAVDETTLEYVKDRPYAPKGRLWDQAVASWRLLHSDKDAVFDKQIAFDASTVSPQVTWGTSPEMVVGVHEKVPDPQDEQDDVKRRALEKALDYMGLSANTPIQDIKLDKVFIGSCTNSRISDIRAACKIVKGCRVASTIKQAMVVPGSGAVKLQAEKEGLDKILIEAGFEWREPGCSMCLGMNPDRLNNKERCASTSNRNFEGRQGKGGRTHLVSPAMAAAAAIAGHFVDVRDF